MKTNRVVLSLLIVASLIRPLSRASAEPVEIRKATSFIGNWEGFVTEGDGSQQGQRRMSISLTITETTIVSGGEGHLIGDGTYQVSGADTSIKHIDATGTSGQYQGKTYQGIFSIEGDTLKWCSGNPGKGRPAALKTNPGAGHFLMVLKRKP